MIVMNSPPKLILNHSLVKVLINQKDINIFFMGKKCESSLAIRQTIRLIFISIYISVLVHSGDLSGGHYFAFVKPEKDGKW